jgi:putative ABC transport system permease protein
VRSAALVADLPLDGGRMGFGAIRTPGRKRGNTDEVFADWNIVSPGYFKTLDIRLVRGRDFTDADTSTASRVAIVNEAMARLIWGTPDALGRTMEANDDAPGTWRPVTIVGVAADAQLVALGGRVDPYIYVPHAQRYVPRMSLVVKTAGGTAIPQMRSLVREMNPNLPIALALPLTDVTAVGLIPQRIAAGVAGSLGVVGLLLAAIGIYGVTSYSVNRRVREIGIRVALGADGRSVLRLILRQGVVLTLVGVGIGLAAGALVSQIVRSLLFGVSALDPVTFGGGAALFLVVAVAASYLPARRATRVDPMVALRAE